MGEGHGSLWLKAVGRLSGTAARVRGRGRGKLSWPVLRVCGVGGAPASCLCNWVSGPFLPNSQPPCLSSALWPGGVLHSHIPLPHAGGPVNSRGDTAWGSPRNSVLPVPKPHTSVGSPGKKPQMGLSCGSGGFPSVLLSGNPAPGPNLEVSMVA